MYTGRMIESLMATVQLAEEHVQRDLELREQVLNLDPYSAYYFSTVAAAARKPAAA